MSKEEVIEWIYNLSLQTLTDELKDDIVEMIEEIDQNKEDEESYRIENLINDTYQVIGETSGTVWKQGTLEECNEWVML